MGLRRPASGLRRYFDHNDGRMIHKWLHYFPIYERHLDVYRGRPITVLEIGVSHGGSLQMWRHYFGRRARVIGVDIKPRITELAEPGIELVVGDQGDAEFLRRLADQYGPFDIVIDDGSHLPAHQIGTVEDLWPFVSDGGTYIVEDLHSNYWPGYGGAKGHPDSFMTWLQARVDDMHAFHSREADFEVTAWTTSLGGIHVYDSVAVLDKTRREPPVHRKSGHPFFEDIHGEAAAEAIDEHHRAQLESLGSPMARLRRSVRDPRGAVRRVRSRITPDR